MKLRVLYLPDVNDGWMKLGLVWGNRVIFTIPIRRYA
jgi:hypothetical protein